MIALYITIGVIFIVLLIINICDLYRFTLTNYTYSDDKITSDIRFLVLSDLHNKSYGKNNIKLIQKIDELQPDMILCAGDMLTATPNKDNTKASNFICNVVARYPVFYALGNHEYRAKIYPDTYGDMYEKYIDKLQQSGVRILDNEHFYIEEKNIDLCGLTIDRKYYKRFKTYPMEANYLQSEIGNPKPNAYEILLAHNPEYCPEYAAWGADVSLGGHIHGGLIRIPICGGIASPAVKFFPKYNGGEYSFGKRRAIVSRGLGTHTLPLRLFDPAELIVLDLKKSQK